MDVHMDALINGLAAAIITGVGLAIRRWFVPWWRKHSKTRDDQ